MSDQKITQLTEDTYPTADDLLVTVNDPAGTPANKKVTVANVAAINPYCFRASGSAATTLTDATVVTLDLATEVYDYNNNFSADAYTAPVAGVYNFSMAFAMGTTATGVRAFCLIYVDDVENARGGGFPAGSTTPSSFSVDIPLTAGQVVTFRGFQDSGGNEDTVANAAQTWACGHLVHRTA